MIDTIVDRCSIEGHLLTRMRNSVCVRVCACVCVFLGELTLVLYLFAQLLMLLKIDNLKTYFKSNFDRVLYL